MHDSIGFRQITSKTVDVPGSQGPLNARASNVWNHLHDIFVNNIIEKNVCVAQTRANYRNNKIISHRSTEKLFDGIEPTNRSSTEINLSLKIFEKDGQCKNGNDSSGEKKFVPSKRRPFKLFTSSTAVPSRRDGTRVRRYLYEKRRKNTRTRTTWL